MNAFEDDTRLYNETVALLEAWARERNQMHRSIMQKMRYPGSSSMTEMIESVKVFETRRQSRVGHPKARKSAKVKAFQDAQPKEALRKCPNETCGHIHRGAYCPKCVPDAKDVAVALGFAEQGQTVVGKQTRSSAATPLNVKLSSRSTRVNAIFDGLELWMRVVLHLSFVKDLQDRLAANVMRMRPSEYGQWKRAAIAEVARLLALRTTSSLRSSPAQLE